MRLFFLWRTFRCRCVCVEDEHLLLSSPLQECFSVLPRWSTRDGWTRPTFLDRRSVQPTPNSWWLLTHAGRSLVSLSSRHGSRGRHWHARWDVRCHRQFRQPLVVLASRDVRTILMVLHVVGRIRIHIPHLVWLRGAHLHRVAFVLHYEGKGRFGSSWAFSVVWSLSSFCWFALSPMEGSSNLRALIPCKIIACGKLMN